MTQKCLTPKRLTPKKIANTGLTFLEVSAIVAVATLLTWQTLPNERLVGRTTEVFKIVENTTVLLDTIASECVFINSGNNMDPDCYQEDAPVGMGPYSLLDLHVYGYGEVRDGGGSTLSSPSAFTDGTYDARFDYMFDTVPEDEPDIENRQLQITFMVLERLAPDVASYLPYGTINSSIRIDGRVRVQILVPQVAGSHHHADLFVRDGSDTLTGPLQFAEDITPDDPATGLNWEAGFDNTFEWVARDNNYNSGCDLPQGGVLTSQQAQIGFITGVQTAFCTNIEVPNNTVLVGSTKHDTNTITEVPRLPIPGGLKVGYAVWARYFKIHSDERLKSDITDLTPSDWDSLRNLRTVKYKNKGIGQFSRDRIGFIAQDIEDSLPDLVAHSTDGLDNKSMLAVDYFSVLPLLVGAVANQEEQITDLESRLEFLQSSSFENEIGE